MNVILLEKMANLGEIGDTAEVKAGFARNFLFPKGKAIPATAGNLANFEDRKAEFIARHDENVRLAVERKEKLRDLTVRIEVNSSDEGKLYGSVGTRDIAAAISASASTEIAKSEILLPHGVIRDVGIYDIVVDFGFEVTQQVPVVVESPNARAQVAKAPGEDQEAGQTDDEQATPAAAAAAVPDEDAPDEVLGEMPDETDGALASPPAGSAEAAAGTN